MSYYVYQNPYTDCIEMLIPCVDDESQIMKDIPRKDGQDTPFKIVTELPLRYFESYDLTDNAIIQNRAKLHGLKKQEWRQLRTKQFTKYDVLFMKALEEGNQADMESIKLIKQQLRDVTAVDVSGFTNQELEDFTPDILKN